MSNDEIHIGNHAFAKNEQRVYLKDAARGQHCHIIGSTGTGKSKLMDPAGHPQWEGDMPN
jgi:ABC-type lipoprotein export system ATPase subunit